MIQMALNRIQSIISIPRDPLRPIQNYHPSFPDFITSQERWLQILRGDLSMKSDRLFATRYHKPPIVSGSRDPLEVDREGCSA